VQFDGSIVDGAAYEKNRLEEKQRAARKQHGGDSSWKPRFDFSVTSCTMSLKV